MRFPDGDIELGEMKMAGLNKIGNKDIRYDMISSRIPA
jgi:hypothetical protein